MDRSDTQGLTAYVSIMGFSTASFPTSHVWQTTNGGASWTDFTANLPECTCELPWWWIPRSTGIPWKGVRGARTLECSGVLRPAPPPSWTRGWPNRRAGGISAERCRDCAGHIYPAGFDQVAARIDLRARSVGVSADARTYFLSISNTPDHHIRGPRPSPVQRNDYRSGRLQLLGELELYAGSTCIVSPTFVIPPAAATRNITYCYGDRHGNTPGDYTFRPSWRGKRREPGRRTMLSFTLKVVDFNLTAPSPASITVGPSSSFRAGVVSGDGARIVQ